MKKTFLALGLLTIGAVSSHAQIYRSPTAQGAVIGGVAGAVIGNNSGKHTAEGALIGAVAGALIGNSLETRTVVVQTPPPPPCPPPQSQVVYVQSGQTVVVTQTPAAQPVIVTQPVVMAPAPVVIYRASPVVYVDAWGRPVQPWGCAQPVGRPYRGYGHWR